MATPASTHNISTLFIPNQVMAELLKKKKINAMVDTLETNKQDIYPLKKN